MRAAAGFAAVRRRTPVAAVAVLLAAGLEVVLAEGFLVVRVVGIRRG
jgi:hypothetical protein